LGRLIGRDWRVALCWALLIVLYLVWPLTHLEAYRWTNDEGLYMQRAALTNAGYPLYAETAFNKPPLLVWILKSAYRLGGPTVSTARVAVLPLTMLGFVSVGFLGTQLWGKWRGVAAMVLLLGLAEVPVRAHVVMADLPAMSLGLTSLVGAVLFQRRGGRGWLVLSGTALAGAVLIHPMQTYWSVPLAAVLIFPQVVPEGSKSRERAGLLDVLSLIVPMVLLGLVVLAVVDRQGFLTWVLRSNYEAAAAIPLAENWEMLTGFLMDNWPLMGLSVASTALLSASRGRRGPLGLLAVWGSVTLATLLVLSPLWRQYLIFLAFPLVMVSAAGVVSAAEGLLQIGQDNSLDRGFQTVLAVLTIAGLVIFGVHRWCATAPQLLRSPVWSSDHVLARAFITEEVPPEGFVASDDALLTFAAGRLVPPPFTEATKKQIELGTFTREDAVDGMLRYDARGAVFGTGRLKRLPGYETWIREVAVEHRAFGDTRVYRLDLPRREPRSAMGLFENGVELMGYALSRGRLRPGDEVTVMLFWRTTESLHEDYHIFVHLTDQDGRLWGQHDGQPVRGNRPSSRWQTNTLVYDSHEVTLSPDAPEETCQIRVGMYPWPSLTRVPVLRPDGRRWPGDTVVLTELEVASEGD